MRLLHIITGLLGLISGAVALYALKGGKVHRKSGRIFVYVMLVMSATGAILAVLKPDDLGTMVAGVLTFYLVITALFTVTRPVQGFHWIDFSAMLLAAAVCVISVSFAYEALTGADGMKEGQPAVPYIIFGFVSLLAVAGDARMLMRGIQGKHRIARHLWRMCFALWIAVASFFLGQAQVFPEPLRIAPLLAAPVLLVLAVMFYWLARTLLKKRRTKLPS
jgi:uncharacterized membrane protein